MQPTRKQLTLPSGAKCVVRKLSVQDFALHAGHIPQAFIEEVRKTGRKAIENSAQNEKQLAELVRAGSIILLECCSPLTMPDGRRLTIVDTPLDKAGENEITIGEMDDADAQAIISAVTELTSLTKEAAEKARPFREEQTATRSSAPAGESVREIAIGNSEPISG